MYLSIVEMLTAELFSERKFLLKPHNTIRYFLLDITDFSAYQNLQDF